jgi:hypothetical protein
MITALLFKFSPFIFAADPCAKHDFFFLPTWYHYLKMSQDSLGRCAPVFNFPSDVWVVGLAVVEMLLRLAGFLAVMSIIVAGVEYMITLGNADKGVAARKRVVNSVIGLAIAIVAAAMVTFIGDKVAT